MAQAILQAVVDVLSHRGGHLVVEVVECYPEDARVIGEEDADVLCDQSGRASSVSGGRLYYCKGNVVSIFILSYS